jgi:hypothetical protein
VPWVIENQTRPLVGFAFPTQPRLLPNGANIFNTPRTDLYFAKRPALESPYLTVAAVALRSGCRELGFWSGAADWEYPLWVLTAKPDGQVRVDGVLVDNDSVHASSFGSTPCLIVGVTATQPASVVVSDGDFVKAWAQGGVSLYKPLAGP